MIICKFKCSCMPIRAEVEVPPRRPDEDILFWMDNCVTSSIYLAHRKLSPNCASKKMDELLIPNPDAAEYIGQEVKLN